jgi:hypothetical protein
MQPVGNVETWLGEVERRMRASVRAQIVAAMAAYDSRPRTQWVCDWPAMVVLAVAQVFWCGGVEAAIAEGGVPAYLDKCTSDLMGLTDLVRAWAHGGGGDPCRTPPALVLGRAGKGTHQSKTCHPACTASDFNLPIALTAPHNCRCVVG